MHIPDGYLSPIVSLGLGGATVPAWAIASRRVQAVLSNKTIPLLAMFSALTFTIMMFNVPVPGGTTAHGVGGTLVAIVLGPAAAVIAVSVALIIQALFFGDGGVIAIFANCLNMAVILPVVGWATYRLIAGRSPLLSNRRVWAAGIGAYVGISVAALVVGIELGIEPALFSSNGHALYSPYGLTEAVPAMLAAHMFGASIVEGLITGLGLAYLQAQHPEYLRLTRIEKERDATESGVPAGRPRWQIAAAGAVGRVAILLGAGLVEAGGDPARLFGADWSAVDWPAVATMLLVVAVIGVILVPLAYRLLPPPVKRVGAAFTAVAVVAPVGLIAPGFAYGEGSADDVQAAFGYVPRGLHDVAGFFGAPLADYNVPLPFFSDASAPLWHAAIGYEIAGIVGILLVGAATYAVGWAYRAMSGRFRGESGVHVA